VTAAAILICVAVCGFLSSSIIVLQMIGLGVGFSVVMDATLVRCTLIPSILSLAGPYAWWAPQPVKRVIKHFGIKH
jgi:RND superfamily putative drug exporter